jgi:hypothetical protein
MALVRDPFFWKRFSTAVHMDEEAKAVDQGTQTTPAPYVPLPSLASKLQLTPPEHHGYYGSDGNARDLSSTAL